MSEYHTPVLLEKSVEMLVTERDGVYVDVTYGGGGHAAAILKKLSVNGCLVGLDRDPAALKNKIEDKRLTLLYGNFLYWQKHLRTVGIREVDGVLADIGVSSHQIDRLDRGFSFRSDARLDMRMNPNAEFDAVALINTYSEERLVEVFSKYGEVRNAKTLAASVLRFRKIRKIESNSDFLQAVAPCIRGNRTKYLARVYQAIRIEVNGELDALQSFLEQCSEVVKPGGRVVLISYHSLEDRIVKRFFKDRANGFLPITKKPIVADAAELKQNSRSRSAKMRVGQRVIVNINE